MSSKSKKSSRHSKSKVEGLDAVCPRCGAWKGKWCLHTAGDNKGEKRPKLHPGRIELAASKKKPVKFDEPKHKEDPRIARGRKLHDKAHKAKTELNEEQQEVVDIINEKIEVLGKHAQFVGPVSTGPIISTYRYYPMLKTKVAHLETLHKDIAVALGAEAVLIKRMPGESAVGFFIPNKKRTIVQFKDTLRHVTTYMQDDTEDGHMPIPINFGITSDGDPFVDDLTTLPHLLIAGTTGGGKSTLLHGVVDSMCWTMSPEELQLYISDTKGVEFKHFASLPHLRAPIANDRYTVMNYFDQTLEETDKRYKMFGTAGVRNIHEYNERQPEGQKMPYIVFVIDELADLMGQNIPRDEAKLCSDKLSNIVARSRGTGIYVVAATQRPDVKQIKGSIKANFPSRLSFRLPSQADSKTILNTKGAEGLMMKGDMLYMSSTSPELRRLHGPYMSLDESKAMIEMIVQRHAPEETAVSVSAGDRPAFKSVQ
jgi:S-DNA-T family DNA segregation ATPase FtsK/SpoIIIE